MVEAASTSIIKNYPNVFGVQQGLSFEQLGATLPSQKNPVNELKDSLSISARGNMMQQLLNLEMQQGSGSSGAENAELDLTGLAQLKQRGEMLASMLKMKMQDFESNLMSTIRSSGSAAPSQGMNLKQGEDGLTMLDEIPNKEAIQNLMKNGSSLQNDFQNISQLAGLMQMLQSSDSATGAAAPGMSAAAQYAQQVAAAKTSSKPTGDDLILKVMQGNTSFAFE